MKRFCFFLALMLSAFAANSQVELIENIKQNYYYVQKVIKAQITEDIPENNAKIVINQLMPAIGSQTIEYNFYFSLIELDDEVSFDHNLNFATRKYNVAQSMFVYEEFLFDENGDLIFYFQSEQSEICKQIRCYFNKNKLIKVIYKEAELNDEYECSKYKVILESKNKLPEDYGLGYIQGTANDLLEIHRLLDK